jgi:hypothetical protein
MPESKTRKMSIVGDDMVDADAPATRGTSLCVAPWHAVEILTPLLLPSRQTPSLPLLGVVTTFGYFFLYIMHLTAAKALSAPVSPPSKRTLAQH